MKLYKLCCLAGFLLSCGSLMAQSTEIIYDTLNICQKNNSDNYVKYSTSRSIAENHRLCVFTSRYTDFNPVVSGKGDLYLYGGGERTYLGEHSGKTYPAWTGFKGSLHVLPYRDVEPNAGFYGVVMCHNGKTFSPENIDDCLKSGKVNTMLEKNVVVLHEGATMASENGTRACRFGELQMETGSKLYGYYKSNSSAQAFYLIGHSGTDAVLAGQILPAASSGSAVGLVKEGSGTYLITGTGCNINAGIRILEGSVLVNSEIKVSSVYAFGKGLLGGSGRILGNADIYGKVNPGDGLVGTLNVSGMQVHPSSRLCIDIVDADRHDCMEIDGSLQYSNICEDFSLSEDLPIIKVRLAENHAVNVGDEFVLIRSGSKSRFQDKEWNFKVVLPSEHTWKVEERTIDGKYCVVLTVTSLEDDPANAGNDKEDETEEGDDEEENNTTYGDDGDRRQIRYYADKTDKLLGVAVSTWYQSLGDESQDAVRVIFNNFNTIVAENEMKFENTEPSRGHFSFGAADQIVSFAAKHNMTVRGHTLAWHSQCPEWVSSDGKKNDKGWTREELLSVLKNHVDKMVRHFKGKVTEWDVVNECLDDDQSILRTNPDGYKLRSASVWTTVIGEDFIDSAFVWAHRADPDARLFLNDYDVEFMGKAKTQALYNLARRLQNDGIPIDGVGLQCHLDVGNVDSAALNSNVARYKDLDLLVELTEVDLGTSSATSANLQAQARNYHTLTNIMLNNDNCTGLVIWGVADNISWRSGSNPLLFANGMVRKPAFYAVRSAFRDYVATDIPIMDSGNARRPLSYCHADGTWTITNSSGSRIVLKEGKKVMVVQ